MNISPVAGSSIFDVTGVTLPEGVVVDDELISQMSDVLQASFHDARVEKTSYHLDGPNKTSLRFFVAVGGVAETPHEAIANVIQQCIGPQDGYEYTALSEDRYVVEADGTTWNSYSATSHLQYDGPDDLVGSDPM